nr:MAG TPA: hypothetical protein [Caudoviricetes sp.]
MRSYSGLSDQRRYLKASNSSWPQGQSSETQKSLTTTSPSSKKFSQPGFRSRPQLPD